MNALRRTRSTYHQYDLAFRRVRFVVCEQFRRGAAPEFLKFLG